MTRPLFDAGKVRAIWISKDCDEHYEYAGVKGSARQLGKSLQFTLHCEWDDEEINVLIDRTRKGWRLRYDSDDGPEELALTEYNGPGNEVVLVHESLDETIYLHMPADSLPGRSRLFTKMWPVRVMLGPIPLDASGPQWAVFSHPLPANESIWHSGTRQHPRRLAG
jgi:hypothetical protein